MGMGMCRDPRIEKCTEMCIDMGMDMCMDIAMQAVTKDALTIEAMAIEALRANLIKWKFRFAGISLNRTT